MIEVEPLRASQWRQVDALTALIREVADAEPKGAAALAEALVARGVRLVKVSENLKLANAARAADAAHQRAAQARAAIQVLECGCQRVQMPPHASRKQWIEVLSMRAENEAAPLSVLAASMSPPMTKDRYAALLRRALRFASSSTAQDAARETEDQRSNSSD